MTAVVELSSDDEAFVRPANPKFRPRLPGPDPSLPQSVERKPLQLKEPDSEHNKKAVAGAVCLGGRILYQTRSYLNESHDRDT